MSLWGGVRLNLSKLPEKLFLSDLVSLSPSRHCLLSVMDDVSLDLTERKTAAAEEKHKLISVYV